MKKVLILSPFFYPEPISTGKYNTYLVEELVKSGCDVEVWCSHPIYPSWKVEESKEEMEGVKIVRGGTWNKYPSNPLLRRAVLEVWFFFYVFFKFLSAKEKFDVTIPIFPPSLASLLLPVFKKKSGYVYGIVHDLQGVYADRVGVLKRILFSIISIVEKRSFAACDHISYLSFGMKQTSESTYHLDADKSSVFYPFVTISDFTDRGRLDEEFGSTCKSIVYSGALGEKQNGSGLIELFSEVLSRDSNIKGFVFSQGPEFEHLCEQFQSDRLSFHSLVPEECLGELLTKSTVQVVPQIAGSSNGSLPSKLPNLLASGCSIFCITDPESELIDIVDGYSKGAVSTTWDVNVNAELLLRLLGSNSRLVESDADLLSKFRKESLVSNILEGS